MVKVFKTIDIYIIYIILDSVPSPPCREAAGARSLRPIVAPICFPCNRYYGKTSLCFENLPYTLPYAYPCLNNIAFKIKKNPTFKADFFQSMKRYFSIPCPVFSFLPISMDNVGIANHSYWRLSMANQQIRYTMMIHFFCGICQTGLFRNLIDFLRQ